MIQGRPYQEEEYLRDEILVLTTRIRELSNHKDITEDELKAAIRQLEKIIKWMEGDEELSFEQKLFADMVSYVSSGGKMGRQ